MIGYAFRTALGNFKKHTAGALMSALAVALALAVLGVFLLLAKNIGQAVELLRDEATLTVFLRDPVSEKEGERLKTALSAELEVAAIRLVSREEALTQFKNDPRLEPILSHLAENPLPASIEIKVKKEYQTASAMERFAQKVARDQSVDEVIHGGEWVGRVQRLVMTVREIGLWTALVATAAAATVTAITIRLHFFSRKEEVEILRLVGATANFIRLPFILEGALLGAAGGLFSLLFLFLIFRMVASGLSESVAWMATLPPEFLSPKGALALISTGVLAGTLGGLFSVR